MPAPPEKVSPKLLFCEWDSLQAQNPIGGLEAPRAASGFELKCVVYTSWGFRAWLHLTPRVSHSNPMERGNLVLERMLVAGVGAGGVTTHCAPRHFPAPSPERQALPPA